MDFTKNGLNCLKCQYRHPDNGNCTAVGGFCTAVPAAYCPLIPELLARTKAAEVRCETLEKMVKEYQEVLIPGYRERAEKAENIASDLCDDFTDFVTGGIHNAAPYCANCRPECVNQRGWCNGDNRFCRGFLPKAAEVKEE